MTATGDNKVELVAIGETMALFTNAEVGRLRDATTLRFCTAGAESNVAIGVRRLGHRAAWIGRVGADEPGNKILADLRREGIDVSAATIDFSAPTGLMLKERRMTGVAKVSYYRQGLAGSRLTPRDLSAELIQRAAVVHLSGISLGLSDSAAATVDRTIELAHAAHVPVAFDFNYRAALWDRETAAPRIRETALRADILFAGEDELSLIANPSERDDELSTAIAVARTLTDGSERQVVIKRGCGGASALGPYGLLEQAAFPVTVLDPVGAGDAFAAGYLAGMLDGLSPRERLRQGCAAGAFAVTQIGDWEGLPSVEDLALLVSGSGTTLR